MCHLVCPFIFLDLTTRCTNCKSPCCAVSSCSLLTYSSLAQISFSASCSTTHSDCVLPSVWKTKCRIHIKQQGKITLLYILLCFWITNGKTKVSGLNGRVIPWIHSAHNFFMNVIMIIRVVPKYLNFVAYSKDLSPILMVLFFPAFCS